MPWVRSSSSDGNVQGYPRVEVIVMTTTPSPAFASTAAKLASRGITVVPLKLDADGFAKVPIFEMYPMLTPADNISHDWTTAAGLGLVLGRPSGNLAVLDVDDIGLAEHLLRHLGKWPRPPLMVRTARHRLHVHVARESAADLVLVQQALVRESLVDVGDKRPTQLVHVDLLATIRCQALDEWQVALPLIERVEEGTMSLRHARVVLHELRNGATRGEGWGEVGISRVTPARFKESLAKAGVVAPVALQGVDLDQWHSTMQVSANVVRLRRRRVIHITPDVAVVVLGRDLAVRHHARVAGNRQPVPVDVDDLGDVFGAQEVLRASFAVLSVRVDEQCLLAVGGAGLDL
jgi:hypothetical protein